MVDGSGIHDVDTRDVDDGALGALLTTACNSALVISLLLDVSISPTTGTHSTPSQTSMIGVESSWMAMRWRSIVASLPSRSC